MYGLWVENLMPPEYTETIMTQVVKDVKKEDVQTLETEVFLPMFDISVLESDQVANKISCKKAMGPDHIFSRRNNNNMKRNLRIREFLIKSIKGSHCRSRLILLNKGKEQIPDITDLRSITIMGIMQKLIETSIVQHLKDIMKTL